MQYEEGEIVSDTEVDDHCMLEPPLRTSEPRIIGRVVPDDPLSSDEDLPHLNPPPCFRSSNQPDQCNPWTIDISEELSYSLSSSFLSNSLKEDRNVENYPFQTAALHYNGTDDLDEEYFAKSPRFLPKLSVTCNHSMKQITNDISKKLNETKQSLIYNVVSVLGKKRALSLYKKTRLIEQNGGLLVMNKSRQRTSGGVFFYLIHCDKSINASQIKEIFHGSKISHSRIKHKVKKKSRKKRKLDTKGATGNGGDVGEKRGSVSECGESEEPSGGRTPPPSPAAPASPDPTPRHPSVDSVLDQTSALLARANDMQVDPHPF